REARVLVHPLVVKRRERVVVARRSANNQHDFARHVRARVVVVVDLRRRGPVTDEHYRRVDFAALRQTHWPGMMGDLQLDLSTYGPAQLERIGPPRLGRGGQGERLEIAPVGTAGSQAGLAELVGDVIRGQSNASRTNAPSFAFVRSKKRDVLPHPR